MKYGRQVLNYVWRDSGRKVGVLGFGSLANWKIRAEFVAGGDWRELPLACPNPLLLMAGPRILPQRSGAPVPSSLSVLLFPLKAQRVNPHNDGDDAPDFVTRLWRQPEAA